MVLDRKGDEGDGFVGEGGDDSVGDFFASAQFCYLIFCPYFIVSLIISLILLHIILYLILLHIIVM